ncbi:DUF2399 domain-containing protein [Geomonas sp. RF6]|uniref:DUF2399 domain-containing protein n=1 Tax=Geomonas sp. RF6 TaxID=2897342 RepID=UPI001E2F49E0|nr:DUF2399 domain-containing protein [Geomonas sp. RF6]UFS72756.1 DUF2399 domain-containing protein [Geomonas sp. RF6]
MTAVAPVKWSAPDADGIVTCRLGGGAVSTLRGRRKRKALHLRLSDIALWPEDWRELLRTWLKNEGGRRSWKSMLGAAGSRRVQDAFALFDALLKSGIVEVEEKRDGGPWQTVWVEFLALEETRQAVGLTNREEMRQLRDERLEMPLENVRLEELQRSLLNFPPERGVRRHGILCALDRWISAGQCGTRRDFSLFAVGDTKGISGAEWSWLESSLDLEGEGISRHTPALWLRAPLALEGVGGILDLQTVPDFLGLSPGTIKAVTSIEGHVPCWRILENRTVFERVARERGGVDGVLWVPGFAPSWWKESVARLLALSPAPVLVACDPDPAGLEIALDIGALCTAANVAWDPWRMDPAALDALATKKPLSPDDLLRLNRLLALPLPPPLHELALCMQEKGEKGEQEGLIF